MTVSSFLAHFVALVLFQAPRECFAFVSPAGIQAPSFVPGLSFKKVPSVRIARSKYHLFSSEDKTSTQNEAGFEEDTASSSFLTKREPKILLDPIPYSELTIGVLKETFEGENRVSQTPDSVRNLIQAGFQVLVQAGAGEKASYSDADYTEAGAVVLTNKAQIYDDADIFTQIRPPSLDQVPMFAGKTLVSQIQPAIHSDVYKALAKINTNVFALDCVPRMLSRGQAFDTLSSQANIAGYRSVIEAAEHFPRFFAGQMTAAGKVPPAKVLVLGAGVAGLAAIQTAKNMGAIVRAFDVRPVTKEQVESMGATFLEVPVEEDGSGSGGYAKEMSDEYKKAQAKLMLEQAKDVDIIITTALIPGRKAPILVNDEMLAVMKSGSVCVDLAAANGGNVALTQQNKVITTENGVKIIGYTDLPSRLPSTASTLFANNVAKFILSIGPQTVTEKGVFQIDLDDVAVQNMLIAFNGEERWPDKIIPYSPPPVVPDGASVIPQLSEEEMKLLADEEQKAIFVRNAGIASIAATILVAFGWTANSNEDISLLATFALAGLAGYQVVWGVAPSLHSPLMAVTNAISGMTALGGMVLLGHNTGESTGLIPDTPSHWAGALATALSFVNIFGGFLVSGKMLDLFRRADDPKDYFEFYALPGLLLLAGLGAAGSVGHLDTMAGTVSVASAICCIAAIAGLSNQKTARTGNVLGIAGVTLGLAATTAEMSVSGAAPAAFGQIGLLGGIGASIGSTLAAGVGPTELPQTVAAFHSLVGLAAMAGASGEFLGSSGGLDTGTLVSVYLATLIGGVTFSGSVVAFGKLAGIMKSSPLQLPGRDQINIALLGSCLAGMGIFLLPETFSYLSSDSSFLQLGSLTTAGLLSTVLGWHLTASIGGADMPVGKCENVVLDFDPRYFV